MFLEVCLQPRRMRELGRAQHRVSSIALFIREDHEFTRLGDLASSDVLTADQGRRYSGSKRNSRAR